jgi:hypothetical protein
MSSLVVAESLAVVLINSVTRLSVKVLDDNGNPVDPAVLKFTLADNSGKAILAVDTTSSRLIHAGLGQYYIDIGNQAVNVETSILNEYLVYWQANVLVSSDTITASQNLTVISYRTKLMLAPLKLMIDKSRKMVDPANDVFLGYSDPQLVSFLAGGIQIINAYQPSGTFSFETYPDGFRQLLIESSMMAGVMSQELYAIDTDIPNYNDQGQSFVISHQPQLAAFLSQLAARLDKMIPLMKLNFVTTGSVLVQMNGSYRLNQLLSAAPSGSVFRNVAFVS